MIDFWTSLPLALRYLILALAGVASGSLVNWAIYTIAYFPRPISPWSKPHVDAPTRSMLDRLPVFGWLGLRREGKIHGRWFWLRPLLIELLLPVAFCWIYSYETQAFGLVDEADFALFKPLPGFVTIVSRWMNYLCFGHLCLLVLMTVATFIDFDERTVPDLITVPGTLLGLALAAVGPELYLPFVGSVWNATANQPTYYLDMTLAFAPNAWQSWADKTAGLLFGLGLFAIWCFALADRRLILRKGVRKAVQFFFAGLFRNPSWKLLLAIWILGSIAIAAVYWWFGENQWRSLFTALAGMAVGGGSVWAVRILASHALRQEAMGFGDVTLMAMIGTFIGWQGSLIAFALAPITSIVIVLIQFMLTGNRVIAFGPYLCAGTIVTVIFWPVLWNEFGDVAFGLGPKLLFTLLLALLLIMWAMLVIWGWIKRTFLMH